MCNRSFAHRKTQNLTDDVDLGRYLCFKTEGGKAAVLVPGSLGREVKTSSCNVLATGVVLCDSVAAISFYLAGAWTYQEDYEESLRMARAVLNDLKRRGAKIFIGGVDAQLAIRPDIDGVTGPAGQGVIVGSHEERREWFLSLFCKFNFGYHPLSMSGLSPIIPISTMQPIN